MTDRERIITAVWRRARARPYDALGAVAGLMLVALMVLTLQGPAEPVLRNDALACLALNVYHEARGEPEAGRIAVAQVVLNRVRDPAFPGDVCAVVRQGGELRRHRCHFSWWCDGRSDRPLDLAAWEESKRAAGRVLSGTVSDPTGGALWYHAEHVSPDWSSAVVERQKIGRHVFYVRPDSRDTGI